MSEKITLRDSRPTKIISLPSLPGSEIEIYPSILTRDLTDMNMEISDADKGMKLLPKYIKSWNLSDEAGEPVPVNADSIGLLPVDDAVFLFNEVQKFTEAQKKS